MSFRDFAGVGKTEKVNIIVSFLAMLELVKEGVVQVTQDQHFDDIKMETRTVGVPHYNWRSIVCGVVLYMEEVALAVAVTQRDSNSERE